MSIYQIQPITDPATLAKYPLTTSFLNNVVAILKGDLYLRDANGSVGSLFSAGNKVDRWNVNAINIIAQQSTVSIFTLNDILNNSHFITTEKIVLCIAKINANGNRFTALHLNTNATTNQQYTFTAPNNVTLNILVDGSIVAFSDNAAYSGNSIINSIADNQALFFNLR